MKKGFFSALLLSAIVFLSSCGDSAGYVNEVLVAKSDKVVDLMEKAGGYIQDDEYDNAVAYLDSVSIYIETSKPLISALKNKSAEAFQKATLEYMDLFAEGTVDYKKAIELYKTAEDNDQMEQANNLINNFVDKTQAKLTEMQGIQEEFAKANGITLR